MRPRLKVLLILLFLASLLGILFFMWKFLSQPRELLQPLSRFGYIQLRDTVLGDQTKKRVLGFLPYWTMNDATRSAEITDIAYFSVTFGADGRLVETTDGERDMGLYRLQGELFESWWETASQNGQRMHITVTVLNNDDISALLRNKSAREQSIYTLTQLLVSYPVDGVVMDVEYAGGADDELRAAYTAYILEVDTALDEVDPNIELSVAVFGSAASRQQLWDVGALGEIADYLVVMSYDYHVRSSATVGPVAPIFGKGTGRWQDDVVSNMRDILLVVPAKKILLGIPFYGYEWTATSDNLGATTFPKTGVTATYKRVIDILSDPDLQAQEKWDADALSPYIVYEEAGNTQFIYYENTRSFSYKLDFVNQTGLGGIAIWALGYEGAHPELWDVIEQKF